MPTDIRHLRQESAEITAKQTELRREARAILASPENEDRLSEAQESRYQAIQQSLDASDERLGYVSEQMARWEKMWEEESGIPASSIGNDATGTLPDDREPEPLKLFGSLGEQMQAVYRSAMGYGTDNRLMELNAAAQGMGEAVGSDGGFLVQQDFASEIFRKMTFNSQVIQRCRRTPVSGNGLVMRTIKETSRATGSRFGAIQGYWVDEGTAPTASEMRFGRLTWSLKKLAALGYATDELLEDAPALSSLMTDAFAEELLWLTENSVFNGTGAGQPVGILNAAATVSQAKETGQPANTVQATNLSKMWSRLHIRSRANAVWFVNSDVEPQLDELTITVGTTGLDPRIVTYGPEGVLRIKGREVIPVEYCATLGTVGDVVLADLSQYLLIDKNGVRQDTSMHVRFTTDEMAFRAIYRVDGQSLWESALTPANGTNTQSPFVTLATRS